VTLQRFVPVIRDHLTRALSGLDALARLPADTAPEPAPIGALPNDGAIYGAVRAMLGGRLSTENFEILQRAIARSMLPPPPIVQLGLTVDDFNWAAAELGGTYAQVRSVDTVESNGGGFELARAAILALDGEGGFIDGENLPKTLFEAHKFARHTGGRFNASHPRLSSPKWNRSLYLGGQREYERIHAAMQLDEEAALKSASVGRYQILGENYELAGFTSVRAFWDAMMESERRQLEAFVSFVKKAGLVDELRRISNDADDCDEFAAGYNGSGYAAHGYHLKIAAAHKKWSVA
jgi:hypothetical protein